MRVPPGKQRTAAEVATSLLLVLNMCLWNAPAGAAQAPSRPDGRFGEEGTVKIRVATPEARGAAAKSGRMVADYGDFGVYEVARKAAEELAATDAAVQVLASENLIELNSGSLDTSTRGVKSRPRVLAASEGSRLHLVQFAGPVRPEWYRALTETGVRVVNYIPRNAYLVWGSAAQVASVQALAATRPFVQWDGAYGADLKVPAKLAKALANPASARALAADGENLYSIQLVEDNAVNTATLRTIAQLKLGAYYNEWRFLGYVNVVAGLAPESVKLVAARADVVSIQPYVIPVKHDERQNIIMAGQVPLPAANPNWLTWLAGKGFTQAQFTASGFAVDVTDSGIDNATTSPNHFGLRVGGDPAGVSRVVYNRLEGTANAGSTIQGCDGHGTLNSHIVSGYVPDGGIFTAFPYMDAAGYRYGVGVAPFVKVGSSVIFDPNNFTDPNYPNLQSKAYNDGARISTNSWGANTGGAYNTDAQAYDALVRDAQPAGSTFPVAGNQEMVIVFSAGNAGSGANTIGTPGTGKNLLTVGAAENEQAFGGADQCGIADSGADSANDVISFSSRGPCDDGRIKPDIQAPGTHVSGGVFQATNVSPVSGVGVAGGCFDATGVCAGPGTSNFWPLAQQWYTASSGTSHSTPATAGAAALVRQYFINNALTPPSPAMTKAWLMSSTRYMTGVAANDTLPSNSQGMGMVNLERAFAMTPTNAIIRDQVGADLFTATGQARTFFVNIVDGGQPFRVTLAWTDAFGPTSGNAYVNNLDLEVTAGGQTYKGNVFTGANSTPGGTADPRNNVESVFLPAGVTGTALVKVTATNIAGDGVPNSGGALDQDFALVVANAVPGTPAPIVGASGSSITTESCAPGNGVVDPGETVTVSLCLQNAGGAADTTAAFTGTLQATGGVTSPSAAQTYGVVTAGGAAVCRSFTFTAAGSCGGDVVATLDLQDGATNLGTTAYTFTMGQLNTATAPFSSAVPVTIPSSGPATPYPTTIAVSGLTDPVLKVTVTLNGLSHTWPDDVDVLLVGPTGASLIVLSDAGGLTPIVNGTVTFDDAAAGPVPDAGPLATGTYQPTNIGTGDPFAAPAPAPSAATALSAFNGLDPNGTWNLYVVDDASGDTGTMTGWALTITTGLRVCCVGCTDTALPVVTPPADLAMMQSTCDLVAPAPHPPAASSGTSAPLLAFLNGGTAIDPPPCESTATMMAPEVSGQPALGHVFPAGTHVITFRAQDVAGNIGTATANLTVAAWMDLDQNGAANLLDLMILGGYFTGRVVPGAPGSPWTAPLSYADISNPVAGVNVIDQVLFQNYMVGNLACLPQ
jgi:subtilisin-like proprotein convertase family protein